MALLPQVSDLHVLCVTLRAHHDQIWHFTYRYFASIWSGVDAVNQLDEFFIVYLEQHNKQRQMAAGFQAVSQTGFDNCAGAIDGILIWIHPPTLKDSRKCSIGRLEFFCGRKGKFGLNCQAVSNVNEKFLEMSIT